MNLNACRTFSAMLFSRPVPTRSCAGCEFWHFFCATNPGNVLICRFSHAPISPGSLIVQLLDDNLQLISRNVRDMLISHRMHFFGILSACHRSLIIGPTTVGTFANTCGYPRVYGSTAEWPTCSFILVYSVVLSGNEPICSVLPTM